MEVGYFTMPLHPPGSDYTKRWEDDLEQIETLDELGYKEAWIGEHFTTEWENIPAPDLFIANALAARKISSWERASPACPTTTRS